MTSLDNSRHLPVPLSRVRDLLMPQLESAAAPARRPVSAMPSLVRISSSRVVNTVICIDSSPSMDGSKMKDANHAANDCLRELSGSPVADRFRTAVLQFDDKARVLHSLAPMRAGQSDVVACRAGGDGTNLGAAVDCGMNLLVRQEGLDHQDGRRPVSIVIIVSDGDATVGEDPVKAAQRAKARGIVIVTIAIGAGRHERTLRAMATSPAHAYAAHDSAALQTLLKRMGQTLSQAAQAGGNYIAALGSI